MGLSIIKTLLILAMTTGGLFVLIAKADRITVTDRPVLTSTGWRTQRDIRY